MISTLCYIHPFTQSKHHGLHFKMTSCSLTTLLIWGKKTKLNHRDEGNVYALISVICYLLLVIYCLFLTPILSSPEIDLTANLPPVTQNKMRWEFRYQLFWSHVSKVHKWRSLRICLRCPNRYLLFSESKQIYNYWRSMGSGWLILEH